MLLLAAAGVLPWALDAHEVLERYEGPDSVAPAVALVAYAIFAAACLCTAAVLVTATHVAVPIVEQSPDPARTSPGWRSPQGPRFGLVIIGTPWNYADLADDLVFRCLDDEGTVVDEYVVKATRARVRPGRAKGALRVHEDRLYRVEMEMGDTRAETEVTGAVGQRVEIEFPVR